MKLTVFCDDRFGMLKNITGVIGDAKSNIRNIAAHTANSQASVEVVLDISDLKHLEQIIVGLRKIPASTKCRDCRKSREQLPVRVAGETRTMRRDFPWFLWTSISVVN